MPVFVIYAPTFLLYLGAILTGWAGGGWPALMPLSLGFLLWHVVMRPGEWPRDPAQWHAGRVARLLVTAASLMVLAGLCLGLGVGLGLFWPLALPVWAGLALTLAATPLQRLLHDPTHDARIAALVDEALSTLSAPARPVSMGEAAPALRLALSSGETDLRRLSDLHSPGMLLDVLSALQADHLLPAPLAQAMIDWVCDPALSAELQGQEAPFVALNLVQEDAALVEHFARACARLLHADPEAFWDCPSNRMLRRVQKRHAGTGAEAALRDLRWLQVVLARARLARERAEWLALSAESADNPAS